MSDRIFEIEGTSLSVGAVFARLIEGDRNFRLGGQSTLGDLPLKGMTVPRALDLKGHQRSDLFGFYVAKPEDLARFQTGSRVVLAEAERSGESDPMLVLDEALLELRSVALLLWPKGRGDVLSAFVDEGSWVPRLGRHAAEQPAIDAIREIRNAFVHGIEPAARLAGFSNIEDYVQSRIASNLRPLRELRATLARAA